MMAKLRIVFALALAAGCTTTEPEQVDFADLETGEPELLGPEIECCSSPSGGLQTAPQTTVDGASYCCDTCRLDDGVWTCSGCGTDPACAGHVFTCLGEYTGGGSCTSGPAGDNCCK